MAKGRSHGTREREREEGGRGAGDERAALEEYDRMEREQRERGEVEAEVPEGQPLAPPPLPPQAVDEHEGEPLELPSRPQPEPATEPLVPGT